ncbi:glycosyltransferase [Butyrivibrio sp. YAB3001]|uniref:glycosyltransferase n=1 Tax=Butyrivibrio sp. YAB3001 TaxID=1520812 RepID=UPI0008F68FE4|nr:glycosyltransferase [Butyrivibrio sp. YAB3001]SFC17288.1 Glycosyl transferases group 1 [Butyrivibrio sp. YAB3001]
MVISFASNYINHHQLPFCDAMNKMDNVEFHFIQTSPMEQKRIDMGWGVDVSKYPFVSLLYEEKEKCEELILNSDVTIFGWTDGAIKNLEEKRLLSGKLSFRVSERIYREGQWKFISPKGLLNKYYEHIRYRNYPVYLLCAGAYVASDFSLIHSYPGKKLKWGYFPNVDSTQTGEDSCNRQELAEDNAHINSQKELNKNSSKEKIIRLCWAGRLIDLKHPEFAIEAAKVLKEKGYSFHLDMIGDGYKRKYLEELSNQYKLGDSVTFNGGLKPGNVIGYMKAADIFMFTSNYLEGWGAVVNEAMQCKCAVVASKEAGAVPFLIKAGENGLIYENGSLQDFIEKVQSLFENQEQIKKFSENAKITIDVKWNAENAAKRLVEFSSEFLEGRKPSFYEDGPMSEAENLKPAGIRRTLRERNVLE